MSSINIDIFSLMIITILSLDYYSKFRRKFGINSYIYMFLIISLTLLSTLNIIIYLYNLNEILLKVIVFLGTLLALFCSCCIYIYVKINMFEQEKELYQMIKYLSIYIIFYIFILFYFFLVKKNIIVDNIYYILNIGNHNYLLLLAVTPLILLFVETFIRVFKNKCVVDAKLFFALLIPILGILFDILNDEIAFWIPSSVLSLIIIYIYRNNNVIYIDPLTNLYNRRILELESFNKVLSKNKVGLFYIDVDDFKSINDTHGHDEGDKILKEVSRVLKDSIRKTDFAIRMGGDEFLLVTDMYDEDKLSFVKNRIENAINKYNNRNDIKMSLSIGYDSYNKNDTSFNDILLKIDAKMYKNKQKKKQLNRRKE